MYEYTWFFTLYTLDLKKLVHMILNVLYTWLCKKPIKWGEKKSCVFNEKNRVNRDRQIMCTLDISTRFYTWFTVVFYTWFTTLDLTYTWLLSSVAIECIGIVRMNQVYGQWSTLDLFGPTLDLSSVEPVFHRWDAHSHLVKCAHSPHELV